MSDAAALADVLRAVTADLPGGGEDRPQQLLMAEAVKSAIVERRHLVVQAGTGTGKTLAYLLPAIECGARVVVSTATRALQDQLALADLPLIRRVLGPGAVRFAVLKGRSNYLCCQRAAELTGRSQWAPASSGTVAGSAPPPRGGDTAGPVTDSLGGDTPADDAPGTPADDAPGAPADGAPGTPAAASKPGATGTTSTGGSATGAAPAVAPLFEWEAAPPGRLTDELKRILTWAEDTHSGDRAALSFEPSPTAWSAVSVGPRECPGAFRCPSGDSCFAERARAVAGAAQVVVVNAALYTAHLAAETAVLPEHDVVVFDEAHELPDVVGRGMGVELAPGRVRAVAAAARAVLSHRRSAGDTSAALAATADQLQQMLDAADGRRIDLSTPSALADLLALIRGRTDELTAALRGAGAKGADRPSSTGTRSDDAACMRALLGAEHLSEDTSRLLSSNVEEVVWVDSAGGRAPCLRCAPVDVGPILAERLWPEVTAVLTSATMPPDIVDRLGLPGTTTDLLDVGSPFAYRDRAMLYVARHLPDRRQPGADAAAHAELVELMLAAGGRTLALFTSWRAVSAAAEAVRPQVPFPVLCQGDLPKPELVEQFAGDEATCLFATASFWQGIDVPGRAAILVVIDRLPFARPDDPLVQARRDRAGARAFTTVDLPRAATWLAQGAGRLIRRADDSGVVAVLDRRLAVAGYRQALLRALPPMRRTVDQGQVLGFLRSLADGP